MKSLVLAIARIGFILAIMAIGLQHGLAQSGTQTQDPVSALERYYESVVKGSREPQNRSMIPIPRRPGKAHGKGDPHATLGPEKLVKVALQHIAEGRHSEALSTLNGGLARYPDATKLMGVRGVLLLQAGQVSDALKDFEAAVAKSPDDALLLVNRAQAYREFGRIDAALSDLNKVLETRPHFVAALFNRGAIYLKRDEFEKARQDFEQCVAVDPHAAAPRFNLAIALDGIGRRDEAIAEMEQFTKIAEKDSWRTIAQQQLARWNENAGASSGVAKDSRAAAKATGDGNVEASPKVTP